MAYGLVRSGLINYPPGPATSPRPAARTPCLQIAFAKDQSPSQTPICVSLACSSALEVSHCPANPFGIPRRLFPILNRQRRPPMTNNREQAATDKKAPKERKLTAPFLSFSVFLPFGGGCGLRVLGQAVAQVHSIGRPVLPPRSGPRARRDTENTHQAPISRTCFACFRHLAPSGTRRAQAETRNKPPAVLCVRLTAHKG